VKRREFITLIGGAAVAWPLAARAQQAAMPVVGWLGARSPSESESVVDAFRQGLSETGFEEGRNLFVAYRWADGRYDRLPSLAAELLRHQVAVIAATGGDNATLAAKAATSTIPIVFAGGIDPANAGIVANLNRPEKNITGVSLLIGRLGAKQLELLHELVPQAAPIAALFNPNNPNVERGAKDVEAAARIIERKIIVLNARSEREIDAAFAGLGQQQAGGILVYPDGFFTGRRDQLIELAARYRIPAIYPWRDYAIAGGLMSYGTSIRDAYRWAGTYVGRVLKGAKPADLPVIQPSKFEVVINLKTARALNLDVPTSLLLRADEVIE
jgi:putative ABC transport system substrate-binding protein